MDRVTVFPKYRHQTAREVLSGEARSLERPPKLRLHRGRLLPYVDVRAKDGSLQVESVLVGPTSTRTIDARAVEMLKESLGFKFKIAVSSIPVRA